MHPAPLSSFQRLMWRWAGTQPFLIVDAMQLRQPTSAARLHAAAVAELASSGVCWPVVDARERVAYLDRPVQIDACEYVAAPEESLASAVERVASTELNRRFRPGRDPILAVWHLSHGGQSVVGMTIQHFTADGYAAGDLFRRIVYRLLGVASDPRQAIDRLPGALPARAYAPHRTPRQLRRYIADAWRVARLSSRVFVAPRPRPEAARLEGHIVELAPGTLKQLQAVARHRGVRINDLLASAYLWSLARHLPERLRGRSPLISITSIVDLRRTLGPRAARAWGSYLGFLLQHLPETDPACVGELLEPVRRESEQVKAQRLYYGALGAWRGVRSLWHLLPARDRWRHSAGLIRSTAALSNSRLPEEWYAGEARGRVGRYWRFGPLGSLVPMIAVATTTGDDLTLTLTCEDSGLLHERCPAILGELSRTLQQPAGLFWESRSSRAAEHLK